MISLLVLGIILTIIFVRIYLKFCYSKWKKLGINGPKPVIPYGNFIKTLKEECNFVEELSEIYEQFKNSDRFIGVFMARKPQIFIIDPKLAKEILVENFKHFHNNISSNWSNSKDDTLRKCSPFVCTGNTWKERRSEIVPTLTVTRMKAFYPNTKRILNELKSYIEKSSPKALDAKALAIRFACELVSEYIWGIDTGALKNSSSKVLEMEHLMIQQSFKCVKAYFISSILPLLRFVWKVRFFSKKSDEFFVKLLGQLLPNESRSPFLAHLLKLKEKKGLSDRELAGHTTTVVIDGFETASALISHCLLLLARNKNQQDKLRTEIKETLHESFDFDELNEIPYLEKCLFETLRIFPPLPFMTKICTEKIEFENSNGKRLTILEGDEVTISSYSFHHDKDFFPSPEEFIPERFDNKSPKEYKEDGVLLPFGDGPRTCLGMKFGLFEAKVAVAEIIKNYKVSVDPSKTRSDNRVSPNSFLLTLDSDISLIFNKIN